MRRRLEGAAAGTIAACAVALVIACGKTDAKTNAVSDGGAPNETGSTQGPPCPTAAPLAGSPCSVENATCEYGGDGDHLLCSQLFVCGGANAGWVQTEPFDPKCAAVPQDNAKACPPAFGDGVGARCPSDSATGTPPEDCVYPEGICACLPCEVPDGGGPGILWGCSKWPAPPTGCPFPRPRLGTACATEGQDCAYDVDVCSTVATGQPHMKCAGGIWVVVKTTPPACGIGSCSP